MPFSAPNRWLNTGHLQTIYSAIGDFSLVDKITYTRTLLRTNDGGTIGLDFVHNPDSLAQRSHGQDVETQAVGQDDTPILVIAHGLTGGSYESYVRYASAEHRRSELRVDPHSLPSLRNVLHYATLAKSKGGLGMRGCVVNVSVILAHGPVRGPH